MKNLVLTFLLALLVVLTALSALQGAHRWLPLVVTQFRR